MAFFFKDLVVWQEAKSLVVEVHDLSDGLPRREIFGITSQLRRAAVSVPSNIAEGQGRLTKGEFLQFLGHARGSLIELGTQLEILCGPKIYKQCRFESRRDQDFSMCFGS